VVHVFDAELVLDARSLVGECPMWWPEARRLVWVDPPRHAVHLTDLDGQDDVEVPLGVDVSAVAPAAGHRLVVAVPDGIGLLDPQSTVFTRLARVELPAPGRFNDGACDPAGRFWAGTFARDLSPGAGRLYRFDAYGHADCVLDGITVSNGMRWSADGRVFYYIDSMTNSVDAFTFDVDSGSITDRRVAVELPEGGADGMTVDADGCLWVARWGLGKVDRFTPEGRLDRTIRVPVRYVTSCEFGGPDLDVLYITTSSSPGGDPTTIEAAPAGGLFACRPGPTGVAARAFAG
jgi:sugar lactone lactonase YvrE